MQQAAAKREARVDAIRSKEAARGEIYNTNDDCTYKFLFLSVCILREEEYTNFTHTRDDGSSSVC